MLPLADCSADALAELLLEGSSASSDSLASVLSADPPLLLWTVCLADRRDGLRPESVEDVAGWLTDHALDVLRWDFKQTDTLDESETSDTELYADRVAKSLQVADLAAHLAAEAGHAASKSAHLLGLLHYANKTGEPRGLSPRKASPQDKPGGSQVEDAVRLAVAVIAGEASLPDTVAFDLNACRRCAAEGRRRWLATTTGLGGRLPLLAAKLARLAELEDRFRQTLEAEKLEAMAEFAAGAGHEINNPLTVIAGRAQLFLRDETDPERRRALSLINSQAMRVHEMIADMMLFARPPEPEMEQIDLQELLGRLVEEVSPRAALQETTLRVTGRHGPIQLDADPVQLTVALQAMVNNSLEAIGRGGRIDIDIDRSERGVEIRVTDDGPGMTLEERSHVFDPYYSARQAGRGLGLGLSKAWRIITNHGGRINVESEPGRGAVFTIMLNDTRRANPTATFPPSASTSPPFFMTY